jgi:serine/tyrosine/threonine adenylyltransferase
MLNGRTLDKFGVGINSFRHFLRGEVPNDAVTQFQLREIEGAHYSNVKPEPVPQPHIIATSSSCAYELDLDPHELTSDEFAQAFSGNKLLPGLDQPYATVYGCHCYGSWFGQLGDGRAMSLGECHVYTKGDDSNNGSNETYEIQLKGCGRTPFSRGFDGRAVVRSSIREFLVSEAMHHLGVPTTRALSVISTGQMIRRPWYAGSSEIKNPKTGRGTFPPDQIIQEPGAVLCRVSKTFLRFAQLELFIKRKEYQLALELADYACYKEFNHLLEEGDIIDCNADSKGEIRHGHPKRYVQLFKEIGNAVSNLVVEWLRVGYVQGNMNSDNTLLGGRTLDYGPYGWMEKFDPLYQPFTSDMDGKFAFMRQPSAMHVNMCVLGECFDSMIRYRCGQLDLSDEESQTYISDIDNYCKDGFSDMFQTKFNDMRCNKLGLDTWNDSDNELYSELEQNMYESCVDYTMFYRELAAVTSNDTPMQALIKLQISFYNYNDKDEIEKNKWYDLLSKYIQRITKQEKNETLSRTDRNIMMNNTNPKYVLRNWMAVLAYEAANEGDSSVVDELHELLETPYEENNEMESKYYQLTPDWAKNMPGSSFLS